MDADPAAAASKLRFRVLNSRSSHRDISAKSLRSLRWRTAGFFPLRSPFSRFPSELLFKSHREAERFRDLEDADLPFDLPTRLSLTFLPPRIFRVELVISMNFPLPNPLPGTPTATSVSELMDVRVGFRFFRSFPRSRSRFFFRCFDRVSEARSTPRAAFSSRVKRVGGGGERGWRVSRRGGSLGLSKSVADGTHQKRILLSVIW